MTMTAPTVTGVCPVLSAAFDDDGAVDLSDFASLCRYVVDSGVRSLMVFGVATENSKLNDQEREAMLETLVRERRSAPVSIVATVADHSTELAMARAHAWVEAGADAINILPSYFLAPPQPEVLRHLSSILDSVSVPVIIQSLPSGGNEVSLRDIVALHADHPNLMQVKVENTPAADLIRDVTRFSAGKVSSLVGWGGLEWEEAAQAGALGVQPGCSFIELYLDAQAYLESDDHAGFARAFSPLRPALTSWMRHPEVLIAIEKHILRERGIISSQRTRHPSAALGADDYAFADQILSLVAARSAHGG